MLLPFSKLRLLSKFACNPSKLSSTLLSSSSFRSNWSSPSQPTLNLLKRSFGSSSSSSLTVWHDLKSVPEAPKPALALGMAGLIPFVAPPLLMVQQSTYLSQLGHMQLLYGATILSFLGGVRWGSLLNSDFGSTWLQFGWSVTPSLIAWSALLMPNAIASQLTVVLGLVLALYVDLTFYGYPGWFKGLRFVLSSVAVLSLWTVLVCQLVLQEKN